jgi:hypothetical protein
VPDRRTEHGSSRKNLQGNTIALFSRGQAQKSLLAAIFILQAKKVKKIATFVDKQGNALAQRSEIVNVKRLVWLLAAGALMLLPFMSTGCGTDDTEADQATGIYTIGPGNIETAEQLMTKGNIK